jgi:hypothetical protein
MPYPISGTNIFLLKISGSHLPDKAGSLLKMRSMATVQSRLKHKTA